MINLDRLRVAVDKLGVIVSVIATLEQSAAAEISLVLIMTVGNFGVADMIASRVEEAPGVREALSTVVGAFL